MYIKILIFQEFQLEIIMLLQKHYVFLSGKLFPFLPNVKIGVKKVNLGLNKKLNIKFILMEHFFSSL